MGLVPISPKTRPRDFIIRLKWNFLLTMSPPLRARRRNRKPLARQRFELLSIALPNAYEVSCRARAWKCPIQMEYAPIVVPPHPFLNGFRLLFDLIYIQ